MDICDWSPSLKWKEMASCTHATHNIYVRMLFENISTICCVLHVYIPTVTICQLSAVTCETCGDCRTWSVTTQAHAIPYGIK